MVQASVMAAAVLQGPACHRPHTSPATWEHASRIEIVGSGEFREQVAAALELLRTRAPDWYDAVVAHVGRIREAERSGMVAWANPPTFELGPRTAFYSVTWCASAIAHDAWHAKLYRDYARLHGKEPPPEVWSGTAAERACLAAQLRAAEAIGAPRHELEHIRASDGAYWDAHRDGVLDARDYQARDW